MNTFCSLVILFFVVSCACVVVQALPAIKANNEAELTNDTCSLPMERGVCRASMPRWGYDSTKKDCVSFFYGGCFGNANNFMTKEECLKVCKEV